MILLAGYEREIIIATRYFWQVMKGRIMLQEDTIGKLSKGDKCCNKRLFVGYVR